MSRRKRHGMISCCEIVIHQRRDFAAIHVEHSQRHVTGHWQLKTDDGIRVAQGCARRGSICGKWIGIILLQCEPAQNRLVFPTDGNGQGISLKINIPVAGAIVAPIHRQAIIAQAHAKKRIATIQRRQGRGGAAQPLIATERGAAIIGYGGVDVKRRRHSCAMASSISPGNGKPARRRKI